MERFYKRVPKKQKFLILSEHFNGGVSISELSRKYQIQPATIYKWREKMKKAEEKPSFDSKQLLEEIKQKESLTKIKGVKTDCDEISVLLDLAKYYKASHLKWTGNHTLNYPFDRVLYFNGKNEQKIEISRVLDEQMEKDTKEKGEFSRTFMFEDFDQECNDQFFSDGTKAENIKQFIYDRIVNILEKKNNQKYKKCWLAIAYEPVIIKINKHYVNKPIFEKIESNEKQLLSSIREIFKKIIFVPNGMQFKIIQSNEPNEYKIFEWK